MPTTGEEDEINAEDATSAIADDPTLTDTTMVSKSSRKASSTDSIAPMVAHQMMPPLDEK